MKTLVKVLRSFPVGILSLGIVLLIVVGCVWGGHVWLTLRTLRAVAGEDLRLMKLRASILHLDEVLTVSARMAAATRKPEWEQRYRLSELALEKAFEEALALAPHVDVNSALLGSRGVNDFLVEMENRAFAHVRQGRCDLAWQLLFSPEYEEQKRRYAQFLAGLDEAVEAHFAGHVRAYRARTVRLLALGVATAAILIFGWVMVVRSFGRRLDWLRQARDDLERRVQERTTHLTEANSRLTNEIAERRRAEQAVCDREEQFRAVVETADDAIVAADSRRRIAVWNPAAERMFGHAAAEALGQPVELIVPERFRKEHRASYWRAVVSDLASSLGKKRELTGRRKDGSEFPVEFSLGRWQTARETYFTAVIHDLSERKRAEEERTRLARMEQQHCDLEKSVRAMERVLGIVGHELRTPLAGIRAMAEYLLTEDARQSAEWDTFIRGINDEIIRMTGMVNDLLEAARLNSGTVRWNWGEVALWTACDEALETIRPLVDPSKVSLGLSAEPLDVTMSGDAAAVRRLLVNLLNNSCKHTPQGQIAARARELHRDGRRWIELQVSDTGAGMPPEVAARLGVAFALNSGVVGESQVRGSGLGLAICRGIVAAHGGTIAVDTAPGRGTTVTVLLRADLLGPQAVEDAAQIVSTVRT